MSTTIHDGKCKFCGYLLKLEIDDACPVGQVDSWKAMASCNRCADFRQNLMLVGDKVYRVLGKLHDAYGTKRENEVRDAAMAKLTSYTKHLMASICQHYKVETYWEASVIDELIEHPSKTRLIISTLVSQVREYARRTGEKPVELTL